MPSIMVGNFLGYMFIILTLGSVFSLFFHDAKECEKRFIESKKGNISR